ncbi:hypothetical protein D3C81_2116670 [compost metagenome]
MDLEGVCDLAVSIAVAGIVTDDVLIPLHINKAVRIISSRNARSVKRAIFYDGAC